MIHSLLKNQFAQIVNANLERDSVVNQLFSDVIYYENEPPEIPIDCYFSLGEGCFKIWGNNMPGGLQYNENNGAETFEFRPIANKGKGFWGSDASEEDFGKAARDFIENVNKQAAFNAFSVVEEALRNAGTPERPHIIKTMENGKISISDINNLKVLHKRLNQSWAAGTISNHALTDLFVPHNILDEIRRWSYSATPTPSALDSIFKEGVQSIWGIEVHEIPINAVFAVDRNMPNFARAMKKQGENVVSLNAYRSGDEIGFEGESEEGWVIGNDRAIVGLDISSKVI